MYVVVTATMVSVVDPFVYLLFRRTTPNCKKIVSNHTCISVYF